MLIGKAMLFWRVFQNWQLWILWISNSVTHSGSVEHDVFARVNTGLIYCSRGSIRAVNLVGSRSCCKGRESENHAMPLCLPLLPNSQLRTGWRQRRKKLEHYTKIWTENHSGVLWAVNIWADISCTLALRCCALKLQEEFSRTSSTFQHPCFSVAIWKGT